MPLRRPTNLKVLEGTYRPDRDQSPKTEPGLGAPPKGLPPAARRFWREVAPQLEKAGIVGRVDRQAFERLCRLHAIITQAEGEMADGITVPDKKGSVKRHPAAAVYQQMFPRYLALLKAFGLTPAARQAMDVRADDEVDPDDDMERLLRGE